MSGGVWDGDVYILPCPHCGSPDSCPPCLIQERESSRVSCFQCNNAIWGDDDADAVHKWNRRIYLNGGKK